MNKGVEGGGRGAAGGTEKWDHSASADSFTGELFETGMNCVEGCDDSRTTVLGGE